MVKVKKINLSAEKTEAQWCEATDSFFLSATPVWFEWLEWIIIIGAIQILAYKTQDILVHLILWISYIFLIFYFLAFFYNIELHGIPKIESERKRKAMSIIVTMLLCGSVYYLFIHLANRLNI